MRTLKIHEFDNVAVELESGHKTALCDIRCGENVIKYGYPIGHATKDIKAGERVHTDNLKTNLGEILEYSYNPDITPVKPETPHMIKAYVREDGNIGIRNDVWIVNTVGCANKMAEVIARRTGALYFPHPYGCSQLGGDHETTQKILRGLVKHPNAGGVLVLGLGCENNNIAEFKKMLGEVNEKRVRFLVAQEAEDEIAEGIAIVRELQEIAKEDVRTEVPVSKLKVGLKCGGSDGFSGITANPLVGRFSDMLISEGGTSVLTEVPEMFGAETLLMNRCETKELFDRTVNLINDFKQYFISHNQVVYENPSPGNKAGGITTLEEKSLGCTQKGGISPVTDVLTYGDVATKGGLSLLNGPGNDIVAVTNLTAAGCHIILFTTGRGTPLGAPVPTVKISTNTALYKKKPHWIDFDAGTILDGENLDNKIFEYILDVANGEETNNEKNGYREIAIFKDGVTL